MNKISTLFITFVFLSLFTLPLAQAAKIIRVEGQKVFIRLDGEMTAPDSVFIASINGKKIGIIRITKVKDDKAIGLIIKGRAYAGVQLNAKNSDEVSYSRSYKRVGGYLSYNNNTLSSTINKTAVKTIGTSYGYNAFIDYDYYWGTIYLTAGLENFAASGIYNNRTYSTNIMYLTSDVTYKWRYMKGTKNEGWVGGGIAFLMPITKSSDIVETSNISFTQAILIGLGFDFWLNSKSFIPVGLFYEMFPSGADVSANILNIRFGYGITY